VQPRQLPNSKTGAKAVYLGQPAMEILRAHASLTEVRIHDLRHGLASAVVAAGQGLPMIGKLLGHIDHPNREVFLFVYPYAQRERLAC
jgi:site-specific recombinase XerD